MVTYYEVAVAHYKATGKRTLLDVAIKNADLVCQVFGEGDEQIHRPSGHPIIELALAKLYKVTGMKKYLNEAQYFVHETGRCTDGHKPSEYSQDHMPILDQEEIVGHAVCAGYLYSGVADVAALTNDADYRVPENWTFYYQDGNRWRKVVLAEGSTYGTAKDQYNHIDFKLVTTRTLK